MAALLARSVALSYLLPYRLGTRTDVAKRVLDFGDAVRLLAWLTQGTTLAQFNSILNEWHAPGAVPFAPDVWFNIRPKTRAGRVTATLACGETLHQMGLIELWAPPSVSDV